MAITPSITNRTQMAVCVETSPGVAGTEWEYYEPNTISTMGEVIGTTERNPIVDDRMMRKGGVTSLESNVGFEADFTYAIFNKFAQGFWFSSWKEQAIFSPTAVTGTDSYTVASGGDLTAGQLVYARGFGDSANNGLKVVDTGSTTTDLKVTDTLVADASPATGARVDLVGVQGASDDITMDSNGYLNSTTLDFTTLGIQVGQWIYIGGTTAITQFDTAGVGEARVRSVTTNQIVLDKQPSAFTTDAGAGKTIQIFIGSFIRNVSYSDADFLTETYTFEVIYDTLTNKYHYPNGNYAGEMSIVMNSNDKAIINYGFTGLDTPVPTNTQKSGTRVSPIDTVMMNTTSDFSRLEIETEDGESIVDSDECLLQSLTVNLNNNLTPKKGLGCLPTVAMSIGNMGVDISATAYFDSSQPIVSIRDNDTVSLNWTLANENGGLHFDIPSMFLGDGSRDFPANDTINLNLTGMAFKDNFFDFQYSCTKYPYYPGA